MASIRKMPTEASISSHQSVRPSGNRQSVRIAQLHSNVRSIKMPTITMSSGGIGVMMRWKGEANTRSPQTRSSIHHLRAACVRRSVPPQSSRNASILRGLDLFQEISADEVGEILVHGFDGLLNVSAVRT